MCTLTKSGSIILVYQCGICKKAFLSMFTDVPADQRLEALQAAVVLMSDENRDVLQSLLLFLSDIAGHSDKHSVRTVFLSITPCCWFSVRYEGYQCYHFLGCQ